MAGPVRKQLITRLWFERTDIQPQIFKSFARFLILLLIIFLMLLSLFVVRTELRLSVKKRRPNILSVSTKH